MRGAESWHAGGQAMVAGTASDGASGEILERLQADREALTRATPSIVRAVAGDAAHSRAGEAEPISAADVASLLGTVAAHLADAEREIRAHGDAVVRATLGGEARAAYGRELFDALPVAALATDLHGTVTNLNTAACLLLRRPRNAVAGKPLATLVHPSHRPAFQRMLARARDAADTAEFALYVSPRDATPVECRVWVRAHVSIGGPAPALLWTVASLLPPF